MISSNDDVFLIDKRTVRSPVVLLSTRRTIDIGLKFDRQMALRRRSIDDVKRNTMKNTMLCILVISLLCSGLLQAQYNQIWKYNNNSTSGFQILFLPRLYTAKIFARRYCKQKNTAYKDSVYKDTVHNKYGDLRNDKVELTRPIPCDSCSEGYRANILHF